jgi:hypothetical protein
MQHLVSNKWQKGNVTRPFDGNSQCTLVLGTCSGLAARLDTAVLIHVTAQNIIFFIIDLGFVYTKIADPFTAKTTTVTAITTTASAAAAAAASTTTTVIIFSTGTLVSHRNLQSCQG